MAIGPIIPCKAESNLDRSHTAYEIIYLMKDLIERSAIQNTQESLDTDRRKLRDALAAVRAANARYWVRAPVGTAGSARLAEADRILTRQYVGTSPAPIPQSPTPFPRNLPLPV